MLNQLKYPEMRALKTFFSYRQFKDEDADNKVRKIISKEEEILLDAINACIRRAWFTYGKHKVFFLDGKCWDCNLLERWRNGLLEGWKSKPQPLYRDACKELPSSIFKNALHSLQEKGYIFSQNIVNKQGKKTEWYSINYEHPNFIKLVGLIKKNFYSNIDC